MSEQTMARAVRKALLGLDPIRVENPAHPGTPDVNYTHGWIELKWVRAWPKREGTKLSLEHFTQQQRVWIQRRSRNGGKVLVLLKVATDWLLYDGATAAEHLGYLDKRQTIGLALAHWPKGLQVKELRTWATS